MALPNIFTVAVSEQIIGRIAQLTPQTQPQWGKMNVAQMLAHCCVPYEYVFENKYKRPTGLRRLLLQWFVRPLIVSEKPYKPSSPTAPDFIIADERDFQTEQQRLIAFIRRTQQLGGKHFDGMESHSFGKLDETGWNNMFYKHLDHHLRQFGV